MNGRYAEWISKTSAGLVSQLFENEEGLIDRADEVDVIVRGVVRALARSVMSLTYDRLAAWSVRRCHGSGWEALRRSTIEVVTLFGTVRVTSPYLYHRARRQGRRPVREQLGFRHRSRTTAVERALTDFGAEESFEQAAERFEEHYGFAVGRTTIRKVVLDRAREAEAFVEQRLAEADALLALPPRERAGRDELLAGLDGSMLRTGVLQPPEPGEEKRRRLERWREVRLGFVRAPGEVDKTYVLRMDGYEGIVEQLFRAAVLRGLTERCRVIATCDGGNGLKEELEVWFHNLVFILDRFHLREHLHDTAVEMGMDEETRTDWVARVDARLAEGGVDDITEELVDVEGPGAERADRLRRYLERFRDAVSYDAFIKKKWPVGSGEVESGHKSLPQKRLKIPGACWHPDNVNPMLALRTVRANGWWDDFWADA